MSRNSKSIFVLTAVQGHSRSSILVLTVNGKPICDFLLVINCNFIRICYRFEIFTLKDLPTLPCLTPLSGGTPWDINVIYTPLKSTFNGLQFRRWQWHYESILICLVVVASQNREITRKSDKIWPYSSSRSSKVIDLSVNGKGHICDFLLVINCNFSRICYRCRDIHA